MYGEMADFHKSDKIWKLVEKWINQTLITDILSLFLENFIRMMGFSILLF